MIFPRFSYQLLVILWLFCPIKLLAQDTQLDSLKQVARNYKKTLNVTLRDTSLVKSLLDIAYQYNDISLDSSKLYIDSCQRFCQRIQWSKGFAYISRVRGHYFFRMGIYDKALENYETMLKIAKKYGDKTLEASANMGIGTSLTYSKHYKESEKYIQRGATLYQAIGDETMYGVALAQIGNSALKQGNYLSAIAHFQKCLGIIQRSSGSLKSSRIVAANNLLAVSYLNAKMYDSSKICEKRCVKLGDKIKNHQNIYDMYTGFAEFYFKKNQTTQSIEYANKALIYANKLASIEKKSGLYRLLYNNYKELNQPQNALQFLEKHKILEDSIAQTNVTKQIARLELTYESEQQKTQIQQLKIEKLTQNKNYLLVFLLLALLLTSIAWWVNNRLKKSNHLLLQKNQEITEALLKGQTLERKRMASDLHDNLLAKISGIRWRFQMIQKKKLTKEDIEIYDSAELALLEVFNDVRLISHNLLPDELEKKGLTAALQFLIHDLNDLGKTVFHINLPQKEVHYTSKIDYELYTIALEITTNILRHAKANNSTISLSDTYKEVNLLFSDDGIGLNENLKAESKGMGLMNVQTRVRSLGGIFEMKNNKIGGAVFKVIVPRQ